MHTLDVVKPLAVQHDEQCFDDGHNTEDEEDCESCFIHQLFCTYSLE